MSFIHSFDCVSFVVRMLAMNLDPEPLPVPRRLPLPLRRRTCRARRRRAARPAGGVPHRQLRGHGRAAQLRRRAAGVERGRPGACRWRCAARSSRRSATPPGRGIPTASRCGSTRATPAPATAPAGIAISSISCPPAAGRTRTSRPSSRPRSTGPCRTRRRRRRAPCRFSSCAGTGGWRLEAFLPAAVLHGFDPEQNPRLGFCYAVRDAELGEQVAERRVGLPLRGRSDAVERAGAGSGGTGGIRSTRKDRAGPILESDPALFCFST